MRVACVQLNSTADRDRNLEVAGRLIGDAADAGSELVVLPEKFNCLGTSEQLAQGAELIDGHTMGWARDLARQKKIWLVAGSIVESWNGGRSLSNTSALIAPDGEVKASYRKIHMFDVDVGGVSYRESDLETAGDEIVLTEVNRVPVGLSICYDLRFPELFRILAVRGARLICLPSAFTERTGRDHWEVLVRARAIENEVFMVAADQIGHVPPDNSTYGRSMIVDPWGVVMAQAEDRETFIVADLNLELQEEIRKKLPSLANRRPQAYRWPAGSAACREVGIDGG